MSERYYRKIRLALLGGAVIVGAIGYYYKYPQSTDKNQTSKTHNQKQITVPTQTTGPNIIATDARTRHCDTPDIDIDKCIIEDEMTSIEQRNQLVKDGFCLIDDPLTQLQTKYAVQGYIRQNYNSFGIAKELIRQIIYYYGSRFNTEIYMELVCDRVNPTYFLIPRRNLQLSGVLSVIDCSINKIEVNEYSAKGICSETLKHVFKYLGHHKGIEPDPLPCPVRSVYMQQIVSDKWDATFIDAFEKKEIFEIILVANELKIQCLLHLGCAKIATLIKQLDQSEINRIIEEEEKYRREHTQDNEDNQGSENKLDNEENTDVMIERK